MKWFLCDCGGRCSRIEVAAPVRPIEQRVGESFVYPFRGEGRGILAIGTVVFGFIDFIWGGTARATMWLIGRAFEAAGGGAPDHAGAMKSAVSLVIFVLMLGTLLTWLLRIVRSSARGRDEIPGFGEFVSAGESMLMPLWRVIVVLAITLGPGFVVVRLGAIGSVLGALLLLAGITVLPMTLTSVAIADSLEGLDAGRILRSIGRIGAPYFLAAAMFLAVIGLICTGAGWLGTVPVIGPFVRAFLVIYLAAVAGRVLGLVYAQHQKQLGWY